MLRFATPHRTSAELRGPQGALFLLENRGSDDALEIEPGEAAGALIGAAPPAALVEQLTAWLGRDGRELASQVAALPAGEYLVARSPRRPLETSRLTLGNERLPVGPNMQLLLEEPSLCAAVVGPDTSRTPGLGGALFGLAFLDANGSGLDDDLVFFSTRAQPAPATTTAAAPAHHELVVTIPVTGELVTAPSWSPTPAHLERWAARGAMNAAERLVEPAREEPPLAAAGLSFKLRSARVARLQVSRREAAPFGLASWGRVHDLGHRRSPLYELDGRGELVVSRHSRGLLLAETPAPEWDFAAPFLEWSEGARVTHGLSLFACLPAGSYLVVRSSLEPLASAGGRCHLRLPDGPTCTVWGPAGSPSDLSQPLLAAVILNPAPAITFFACVEARSSASAGVGGDVVLVLPTRGELVAGEVSEDARASWHERDADAFALSVAGA